MKRFTQLLSVTAAAALYGCLGRAADVTPVTTNARGADPTARGADQTSAVVAAAKAFLDSLSATQRMQVQFPFTQQKSATAGQFKGGPGGRLNFIGEQYGDAVWSNYPVSDVPRPGLRLGTLTEVQRAAAMHLLQVVLSAEGYQKVNEIMGADQALSEGGGNNFSSGAGYYFIGIFGTPSATAPWMLEFGGHHLGLNITIAGKQGVMTPTLTGAQPDRYSVNGKTVRVLAEENDRAFALLNSLDGAQRAQAILNYRIGDLVLGPGHAGQAIQPEGLRASALNARQRTMLLDVISAWTGIINDTYATPRMAEVEAGLNDTWFAWSGPTTHEVDRNGSAYYRIQGPRIIIEFSPQGVGGDPTMHVHTMYRDPANDYGVRLTAGQ